MNSLTISLDVFTILTIMFALSTVPLDFSYLTL